ncbi:hypothetical protein L208DRAFT_529704 [Tricholoma matsutake]|nr:hypothetical protein L208DRAFT_529704 [Tricholoma matsutake 945]
MGPNNVYWAPGIFFYVPFLVFLDSTNFYFHSLQGLSCIHTTAPTNTEGHLAKGNLKRKL